MRAPFGARDATYRAEGEEAKPSTGPQRFNLELACDDKNMVEFFDKFDKRVIGEASTKSEVWFKKKLSEQSLSDTLYRFCCVKSTNPNYAPLLRVKIDGKGTRDPTKIFIVETDASGKETYRETKDPTIITANSMCMPIVKMAGLWFVSKGFGATIVADAVMVWPNDTDKDRFDFILPSDGPTPAQPEGAATGAAGAAGAAGGDSAPTSDASAALVAPDACAAPGDHGDDPTDLGDVDLGLAE